ncbi:MAG: LysM peptidoglycan-binding domain-containing protein, partial [Anaerolineae bacterium]
METLEETGKNVPEGNVPPKSQKRGGVDSVVRWRDEVLPRHLARLAVSWWQWSNDRRAFWPWLSRTSAHIALVIAACLTLLLSTIRPPVWAARSLTSAADLFASQNRISTTQETLAEIAARNRRAMKPNPWAPIALRADPHTEIPKRPRLGVITYTVQLGDTVQAIAAQFGLEPTTI